MTFDKQRTRFHNPRTSTGSHGRNTQAEEGLVPRRAFALALQTTSIKEKLQNSSSP